MNKKKKTQKAKQNARLKDRKKNQKCDQNQISMKISTVKKSKM